MDDSLFAEDSKYFAVGLAFVMPSHHLPDGNNYYPFNIFAQFGPLRYKIGMHELPECDSCKSKVFLGCQSWVGIVTLGWELSV